MHWARVANRYGCSDGFSRQRRDNVPEAGEELSPKSVTAHQPAGPRLHAGAFASRLVSSCPSQLPSSVSMAYIGRLAPSPTGYLHLGHAATFLAAGDRAQLASGRLFLRMDDLDPQRSQPKYVAAAKADLLWLGLSWDAEFLQSQ